MDFDAGKAGGIFVETRGEPLVLIPLGGQRGKNEKGEQRYAMVDAADYHLVADRTWRADQGGRPEQGIVVRSGKQGLRLHRVLLGIGSDAGRSRQGDHANLITLDNRRMNIRVATSQQNKQNQRLRRDNQCGIKGVGKDHARWRARIRNRAGQLLTLGTFDSPEEAGRAYDRAARDLHGEFARTNSG